MPRAQHVKATLDRMVAGAKRVERAATDAHGRVPATFAQRAEADVVRLLLPVPVSVNAIYERNVGGGLRLSKAYSAWLSEAGWRLNIQRPGRVSGRYQLIMRVPEESRADIDNLVKGLSDLLQLHGVVRNDNLASRIVLEWQAEQPLAMVEVIPFSSAEVAE